jgi:ATP adenylyltransferase
MDYVETPKENKGERNPFTELPKMEDKEALIIYRSSHAYIVMNKFPYNAGHLLVIPYREVPDISELDSEEITDFWAMVMKAKDIIKKALDPDGYNVGMNIGQCSGAGIPKHVHCHIVPRWTSDTNFMPVIDETRVLHRAMDKMWTRLREFA